MSLAPDVQGKGLGGELVGTILAWAAESRPSRRITCLIDPDNTPSIRLAERHGFREFDRTAYHGAPVVSNT